MNPEDKVTFDYAMSLVHSGKANEAYTQFNILAQKNANNYDPDLLLWLAFTTPYQQEAQQALSSVTNIAPNHPGLAAAKAHYNQRYPSQYPQHMQPYSTPYRPQYMQSYSTSYQQPQYMQPYSQPYMRLGPPMHCPYCHGHAPVRIENKISTAGWIIFAVLIVVFIPLCWIGILIKEDHYVCSNCNMKLG